MPLDTPLSVTDRLFFAEEGLDRSGAERSGPHAESMIRALGTVGSGSHSGG